MLDLSKQYSILYYAIPKPFDLIRLNLDKRIYVMLWSKNELHNKL